jgi:hypothetical protein
MEKVLGTFQKVQRIKYCRCFFVVKVEVCFHFGNTQHFQSLDIVGTHVTESGNNLQSSILADIKKLFQKLHNYHSLSASTTKLVSYWLLLLVMQIIDHEKQSMAFNVACPVLASKIFKTFNAVKLFVKSYIFLIDISSNMRKETTVTGHFPYSVPLVHQTHGQ